MATLLEQMQAGNLDNLIVPRCEWQTNVGMTTDSDEVKQVWLVNHYAQEPGNAGGTRHYGIATHAKRLGWSMSIIGASVELNTGRQRLARNQFTKPEYYNGVQFLWIRTPQYRGNGLGRIWNMLVFSLRVLLPSATNELQRPDVVIGSSVHPLAAWAAARLAKRFHVPFIFEVRDLWPQTLVDLGKLTERSVATLFLRRLEKALYVAADAIIVLLPKATEYIVPLGVRESKITWIPNGVELGEPPEPVPMIEPEYFTFMYFGAHGNANALDTVLEAMAIVENQATSSKIRLRLIGDGPDKEALRGLARKLCLKAVSFENPVPKRDIPKYAAQADAFIFNLLDVPVFKYGVSSNKLFDFMAASRPVIFCCGAANNPVEEAGAGITVRPGRPKELADAMCRLAATPVLERIAMGQAGLQYVRDRHDYRKLASRFCAVLNAAVNLPEIQR